MTGKHTPAVERGVAQMVRVLTRPGWNVSTDPGRPAPADRRVAYVTATDDAGRLLVRVAVTPSTVGSMGRIFTVRPHGELRGVYPRTVWTLATAGTLARQYATAAQNALAAPLVHA